MPLGEIVLTAIADAVFGYLLTKYGDTLGDWARSRAGREPMRKAFKNALGRTFAQFEQQYPQWVANHFDASFFEHEGAPILAQFLVRDGHPDPCELAARWADALNLRQPERRTFYTRQLESVASDFLTLLAHHLKAEKALRELHDSRTFEQLAEDVQAIRLKLAAGHATEGTRRDYLRWLISRNLYIDTRGTLQIQRHVQVKLDDVYVSLQAQNEAVHDVDIVVVVDGLDEFPLAKRSEVLTSLQDATPPATGFTLTSRSELLPAASLQGTVSFIGRASFEGAISRHQHVIVAHNIQQAKHQLRSFGKQLQEKPLALNIADERIELSMAASRHARLLILGDPGSGKTTLLRFLALKHAQALYHGYSEAGPGLGSARFPILIRIAEYADEHAWKKQSLSDFIAKSCVLHECPSDGLADLLHLELEQGHGLILLDGLDEIVHADERRGVVEQIENFVRRYIDKGNICVITSRIVGYSSAPLGEPFARYTICEMDEVQIHRFLQQWCQAVEDAQTPDAAPEVRKQVARREIDGIMKAIRATPGVRRLAVNPLLLRTLALIHRAGAQLPQKRVELYKLAADTLARTWRTTQGVPESALVDESYLTRLLGKLAYWLHAEKPTGSASEREVYKVLGEEWTRIKGIVWEEDNPDLRKDVERFLRAVREHTGLFVERAPKRYGFMHLTFEEYYAARYLVARSKTRADLIRKHLHHARWDEPILLALGFVGLDSPEDAADLVETAILARGEDADEMGFRSSPYESLLARDYLFALRCLGDDIPVSPLPLKQFVSRLSGELLQHDGPARFQRYRQALSERLDDLAGSRAGKMLSSLLLTALQDADASVRQRAVDALVRLEKDSPALLANIIELLHHERIPAVQLAALNCLPRLEQASPELFALLIDLLHRDRDDIVRWRALHYLNQLWQGSQEVVTVLLEALDDLDLSIRCAAAEMLWQRKQWQYAFRVLDTLLAALDSCYKGKSKSDDDIYYVLSVVDSLDLTSSEAVTTLLNLLHDSDAERRQLAVTLLKRLEVGDVRAALADSAKAVRIQAAESLICLGIDTREAVEVLLHVLRTEHQRHLLNDALAALQRLEHPPGEAIATLLDLLKSDQEGWIRLRVLETLGAVDQVSPEVIAALSEALRSDDMTMGQQAGKSLGRLAQTHTEARKLLLASLHAQDPATRFYAVQGLAVAGRANAPKDVIRALMRALQDNDQRVRYEAAQSLGALGQSSPEIAAILLEGIESSPKWSWQPLEGIRLLGNIGAADEPTMKALLQTMLEQDDKGRESALALARLGQRFPEAVERIASTFMHVLEIPLAQKTVRGRPSSYETAEAAYEGLWLLSMGGEIDNERFAGSSKPVV